jgi:chorismate dehydratase
VILAHQKPLETLEHISLDAASLTSATLLKVLLKKHWKIDVELREDTAASDGQLLIGDRANQFRREFPRRQVTDLGLAWRSYTGLPFVFAAWALHSRCSLSVEEVDHFRELCDRGLRDRQLIAQTPEEYCYLTEWIRYGLGPFEKEAIKRFAQEINELALFPYPVETQLTFV